VAVVAAACLALAAATAAPAAAASKNGITPVTPKAGSTVASGKAATFRMRVRGKGPVWVYVCRSRKRDAKGLICSDEWVVKARKRGRHHVAKGRFFDYPEFWLNTRGTYYWQAHRIDCSRSRRDCAREGPVVKFKVR
jgi:hypothetical protein